MQKTKYLQRYTRGTNELGVRFYDIKSNKMLYDFNMEKQFYNEVMYNNDLYKMLLVGVDSKLQPIFEGDIVVAEIMNEFGSFQKCIAIIRQDRDDLQTSIDIISHNTFGYGGVWRTIEVLGNVFENEDYLQNPESVLESYNAA